MVFIQWLQEEDIHSVKNVKVTFLNTWRTKP